jgi:ubiquinone/menaquinone biosynthesis C-methylase UbiE
MVKRILILAAAAVLLACGPVMIEREGRLVFNPNYYPLIDGRFRDGWQQPDAVLGALSLAPSAVVADVGAGGGYFTERFSRAPNVERVFAVDVQDEALDRLEERVRERGLENVTIVRATFDDPGLAPACCDLVFFSSVYKEVEGRVAYMERVRRLLRPGGRVAILEFLPDAPGAGPPPELRLAPDEIVSELDAAGFELVESFDVVETQSYQVFEPREREVRAAR